MLLVEGSTVPEVPEIVVRSTQITGIRAPLIAISRVTQQNPSLLGAQEVIGDFVISMGGYCAVLATAMAIVFVSSMVRHPCR